MIANSIAGFIGASTKASYSSVILADSPIGFWLLNETSGSTATDSSTSAINATYVNSPTLNQSGPSSQIPKAVQLNGTSQYALTASTATYAIAPSGAWSIEGWVKATANNAIVFEVGRGTANPAADSLLGNGQIFTNVYGQSITSAGAFLNIVSSASFNDNAWHYIALTAVAGGVMTLYVDGNSVASSSTARRTAAYNSKMFMGCSFDNTGNPQYYLQGYLAACAIYNTALSSTTITAHYNAGI